MPTKFAGADWLVESLRPAKPPSKLGLLVADILGQVFRGLYHLDNGSTLRKPYWHAERYIEVNVYGSLATYDSDELTTLVLACHEQAVRLEIRSGGPHHVKLCFSPRVRGSTSLMERHPDIDEAVAVYRRHLALDAPQEHG